MKSTLSYGVTDFLRGSLRDKEAVERGQWFADFISDVLKVKGAGEYLIHFAMPPLNSPHDHVTFEIEACMIDTTRLNVPHPVWETLPSWANWWTVSATGKIRVFAEKPEVDKLGGMWWQPNQSKFLLAGNIDIPIGIDWRTLCFERPRHMLDRGGPLVPNEMAAKVPEPPATATSWWRSLLP